MIWVKQGSTGREVVDVQTKLLRLGYDLGLAGVDGVFGPVTERAVRLFQEKRGREADGIVGPDTWREMVDASYRLGDRQMYLMEPPLRGDDIRELQATLNNVGFNAGRVSGVFAGQTDKAVRDFQRNTGLDADGIVGETTIQALDNFRMRVSSGGITGVWDKALMQKHSPLSERRVAIDHDDKSFSISVAALMTGLLEEAGAKPIDITDAAAGADDREHAVAANKAEADVLVRIKAGKTTENLIKGSVCEYFDNGEFFSARSKELAGLIENEMATALRVFDNGIHGRNLTILQATRMPAVVVKPIVNENPHDAIVADRPEAAAEAAAAIIAALHRYWEE